MSLPNIEVVEPRQSIHQSKENGQEQRRVTEVTVSELLQLQQLNGDQMGKLPEASPKANEDMEVVVKLSDNMSVNLKCNANVTTVDLLTQLVAEIRDLTTQINSNTVEAKLTVPQEDKDTASKQQDTLSEALNQISTVKELLVKKQVPTLKLELSPRSTLNSLLIKFNTNDTVVSDSTSNSREVSRVSQESERSNVISLSPRPGSHEQGLTPRKKDITPRPTEERPSLVVYMNTLLGDRAAISPEEKKNLAKKFKRPTKRDKKSNNSSSSLKKTPRTMRSTRTGGWVQTRPTGVPPQLNMNSGEFAPSSPTTERKNGTLRAKPPSPEDERQWTSTSPRSSTPPDEGKIVTTRQNTQKSRTITATPRLGNFLSVERQSLLSQSKVLKTDEKELAKEKLPTPIQKKHIIQVKLTCRLPENKVVEERFDVETAIVDVKTRIYELASHATIELEPIDSYIFEFTDTKIFIFKENVTLKSLGIVDTQRSEYLTLALRSEALDVKNIIHKLNTILGGIIPAWDAKDTEESDFRKKIARNSPSTVFSNVPLAQLTEAPLPFDFPKRIFIRFRLPDQTTKTLECDAQDSLQTVLRTVAELTARQTQRQIAINDHVIKLCGRAQFILEDVVINKVEYVRNAIERRKRIEFHLVPLAQLFEWLHYRAKTSQGEFTRAAKRQVIRRVQTVESDEEDDEPVVNGTKLSDEGLLLSTTVLSDTLQEDRASSDPTDATLESDLSPLNLSPRSSPAADTETDDTETIASTVSPRPRSGKSARAARIVDPSTMKAAIKAQLSHERNRRTSYTAPRPSRDETIADDQNTSANNNNNTNVVRTPGYAPESNPARLTHTASKAQLSLPEILRCQDFSLPFSVRIVGISRLTLPEKFTRTLRSREAGVGWIEAVTVHRGEYLTQPTKTPIIPLTSDPQWQVDLAIGPALRRLPRETRLVLTLVGARAGVEGSQMILGWTALPLFDFRGVMVRGELTRYMRLDEGVSPIGPVSDSVDSKLKGINKLELLFDDWGHEIYHVAPLPRIMNLDNYGKPSSHTIHQLQRILRTDTLWSPEPRDKQLLWHYRYAILKEIPQLLNKLLLCIDWTNRTVLEEMYSLLDIWPALDPLEALELLDAKYSDTKVREYAVKCLHKFSDEELKLYLLQLMQVLKYEPHHYSALAQFLLDRACRSEVTLGVAFFWYLHAEVDSEYRERFALIMEAFLMHCSERQREEIFKQLELMKKLKEISIEVKEYPKDKRRDELIKRLKHSMVPRDFQLPLDPTIIVKRIDIDGCRVFDSAQAPLMLSLVLEDSCADPFPVIFKQGDDLRQDILTIQVLTIMDKLWKQNGLDLHLTRYAVLATSSDVGLIQVVTNAMTACKIQKSQGGALTGALKNLTLLNWIQEQNPNAQDFERAVDNFILSCAGYSVATYVLGVGDRHSDNIMVDRYGHFFHIDFGHFLGNFKYFGLLNRDKAPFAFPPEFAAVMGNKDSERFKCFVEICCRAFNIVRANANVFLNLFAMMLSTGIAELRSEEDLLYLKGTMALHLTDDEAAELFRSLVYESLNTTATRINFLFHMWAH